MMTFGVAVLIFVVFIAFFIGFGLLSDGAGVPDIDQAADVMGARLSLDEVARDALKEGDQDKYDLVNEVRQVLAASTESQGFRNDDSSRWLPGGEERFIESFRRLIGKDGKQ